MGVPITAQLQGPSGPTETSSFSTLKVIPRILTKSSTTVNDGNLDDDRGVPVILN